MKLSDKQELVRLLALYQNELLQHNGDNIKEAEKYPGELWERRICSMKFRGIGQHVKSTDSRNGSINTARRDKVVISKNII